MNENLSSTRRMLTRVRMDADQREGPASEAAATAAPATINDLLLTLVAELTANDVPAPLAQSFTLATVLADLCRLAGEPLPAEVAALVEGAPA